MVDFPLQSRDYRPVTSTAPPVSEIHQEQRDQVRDLVVARTEEQGVQNPVQGTQTPVLGWILTDHHSPCHLGVEQCAMLQRLPFFPDTGKPRTARRGRANPNGSGFVVTPLTKHLLSKMLPAGLRSASQDPQDYDPEEERLRIEENCKLKLGELLRLLTPSPLTPGLSRRKSVLLTKIKVNCPLHHSPLS
ncbi:hypothetical protein HPB47_022247 [Ixodes persulcatus]|uniref:Uncharacterized protein n=1 Tax=Ixodes persulcatus TaxID=34615 RepID=A0AC60QCL1_IXOPE|nr:hypothetical protein HPB47_022247 [Ixodes persulcatus]